MAKKDGAKILGAAEGAHASFIGMILLPQPQMVFVELYTDKGQALLILFHVQEEDDSVSKFYFEGTEMCPQGVDAPSVEPVAAKSFDAMRNRVYGFMDFETRSGYLLPAT